MTLAAQRPSPAWAARAAVAEISDGSSATGSTARVPAARARWAGSVVDLSIGESSLSAVSEWESPALAVSISIDSSLGPHDDHDEASTPGVRAMDSAPVVLPQLRQASRPPTAADSAQRRWGAGPAHGQGFGGLRRVVEGEAGAAGAAAGGCVPGYPDQDDAEHDGDGGAGAGRAFCYRRHELVGGGAGGDGWRTRRGVARDPGRGGGAEGERGRASMVQMSGRRPGRRRSEGPTGGRRPSVLERRRWDRA